MTYSVNYIFDVDGTLTPSRCKMDPVFAKLFLEFCSVNNVYLVTGSDRPKTIEQIGETIYNKCKRVYQCSGSEVYEGDTLVFSDSWELPGIALSFLVNELRASGFSIRTGKHIEHRVGMVNFSVVGRSASPEDRASYVKYDKLTSERACIANRFNSNFPSLHATVAGETGLDISRRGSDKSQILRDFTLDSKIAFFGDSMGFTGNDRPLATAMHKNYMCSTSITVQDWNDIFNHVHSFHNNV